MRLPRLSPDDLSPRQREVAARIAGPRGQVRGPFPCLLHSPELADRIEPLASYVRGQSALPPRLRELIQLIAARFWDAQDQWGSCMERALAAGLAPAVIEALAAKRPPPFADEAERVLYRFCRALLETHFVADDIFAAARALLGDAGLVDAIASLGTFTMMAFVLNACEVDPDPSRPAPFPDIRGFARVALAQPLPDAGAA